MGVQLVDNKTSVLLITPEGTELILKKKIRGIIVVGKNGIRIDTGVPIRSYHFQFSDVTAPKCVNIGALRDQVSSWIKESVCCNCSEGCADNRL